MTMNTPISKIQIEKNIKEINKLLPQSHQTKLGNINKARVDGILPTKRVSKNSRICMPYKTVVENKLITLNQLNTYENGIVISLPFHEYIRIEMIIEQERTELDNYLYNNIGSDNIVASIIILTNEAGSSGGSTELKEQFENLNIMIKEKEWKPIKRKDNLKDINKGNDKWIGHYYYNICGGSTTFKQISHPDDIPENQIFTSYKSFMINESEFLQFHLLTRMDLRHRQ